MNNDNSNRVDDRLVREIFEMMTAWGEEDARELADTGTLRLEPGEELVRFN